MHVIRCSVESRRRVALSHLRLAVSPALFWMVERRLFEYEPNKPIGFFLHSSIQSQFRQRNLSSKIRAYGGKVLDSPSGADTVLVDEKKIKSIGDLQIRYSMSNDKKVQTVVVEPMKFIHICINTGQFIHIIPKRLGMGGRPAGSRKRNEFTDEEDMKLCRYISRRIPDPSAGGRLSIGTYVELVRLGDDDDPEFAWVRRHTAASWHERYRKNRARLDPIIQKFVDECPRNPFAEYKYNRHANKKNRRLGPEAQVIEITDGSEDDAEFEESFEQKPVKPSKRARIESNSPSSSGISASIERHTSYSRYSPDLALNVFEPQTPAPSATLVNKVSQRINETTPSQAVCSPTPPPHPSTSFRDVFHSSPVLRSGLPSNETSRTEPSSRSLAVLSGLSHPPQNTSNPPAESSILRESAHKRSSPIPPPARRAARRPKSFIQQPHSPPSNGVEQENPWAPYKNTRSRSRSVEPIPLQASRKKATSKRPVRGNDVPLAPVFEGDVEQEHGDEERGERGATEQAAESRREQETSTTTMTETMQEEHDVEDLLMVQSNGAISGTASGARDRVAKAEEQDDDAEETLRAEKRPTRKQPLFELDSDDDAIDQMMTSFPPDRKSFTTGEKGKSKERVWMKEEEEESEEENLVKSEARPSHQARRQASLSDDDDEIDRILAGGREMTLDTLEELMASSPPHHTSLDSRPDGRPLQGRDENRRATFPFSTPANKESSKPMRSRPSEGPELTSLTPSSFGTLPEAPHTPATQLLQPSKAPTFSSSKRSRVPSVPKPHQPRRRSLESVSSEVPFPLTGTKASSVKAIMEQHLKESPYSPPSGTKAAAVKASQGQLRSRKQRY